MKSPFFFLVTAVLLLTGCNQPDEAESVSGGGGTIKAINHTKWAINHFSVNGQSGIDSIGPFQGGGGGGYFGVPPKWEPGMTVKISGNRCWVFNGFSGFGDDKKSLNGKKIKSQNREHSAIVPVPDYNSQKTCGIKIHFLPCDKVKVTTSCYDYGNPITRLRIRLRWRSLKYVQNKSRLNMVSTSFSKTRAFTNRYSGNEETVNSRIAMSWHTGMSSVTLRVKP